MTTRLQVLRSSTTATLPAAGTRLAGELWVNFADLHLGVIDAARNAQKLVAVRYFLSTATYAAGDFVVQAGALYVAKGAVPPGAFSPAQWTQVAAATDPNGPYLPIAGGTLTGALILAADPGAALGAATKQYVDGKVTAAPFLPLAGGTLTGLLTLSAPPTIPLHAATKAYVDSGAFVPIAGGAMTGPLTLAADPAAALQPVTLQYLNARPMIGDNRIINGDMRIDQRNNGASGTAGGYTVDRWWHSASQAGKGTWQRGTAGAGTVILGLGFGNFLAFTSSSAYAVVAADNFNFRQPIEADMVTDFAWGTANAQPVTLSMWVSSSGLTYPATFGGAIANAGNTRSYPFSYSIPAAGAWTKITITIPGDTLVSSTNWVMSGNAASFNLIFGLGVGSTNSAPAGAWAGGAYTSANGAVSVVGTNGATFYVTGVKLEAGSVATPFNRQSLAKSMADCQRYYQTGQIYQGWYAVAGMGCVASTSFQCAMRASPTMVIISDGALNLGARTLAANINLAYVSAVSTAVGQTNFNTSFAASAEL